MGAAYKNFWSLNTDEAVVAGMLKHATPSSIDVLMPLNAQLKDVDLVLMDLKNNKTLKIQVKGSRAYEPRTGQINKWKFGSAGWFYFDSDVIHKNTADYFVFLIYVLEPNPKTGRRNITPHALSIPTKELKSLCKKYKTIGKGNKYNFTFWVDPINKKSFDFKDTEYDTSVYLDKKGFEKMISYLK